MFMDVLALRRAADPRNPVIQHLILQTPSYGNPLDTSCANAVLSSSDTSNHTPRKLDTFIRRDTQLSDCLASDTSIYIPKESITLIPTSTRRTVYPAADTLIHISWTLRRNGFHTSNYMWTDSSFVSMQPCAFF